MSSLLLIDDDVVFSQVLARALENNGYEVVIANDIAQAQAAVSISILEFAVVDLRIGDESGLTIIPELLGANRAMKIVVLTGYASIPTAVEAIKLGATHYLTKPTDADEVVSAFAREKGEANVGLAENPLPLKRLEWEHIQKVLADCDGNISEAARRLNMHRRSLQRKLQKRPVKSV